jgi:hypothetical protein
MCAIATIAQARLNTLTAQMITNQLRRILTSETPFRDDLESYGKRVLHQNR